MFHYKRLLVIVMIMVVSGTLIAQQLTGMQKVFASESSPYDSGYDHGCDDAGRSESDKYINQPEKGPSFHTNEFMDGYYAGLNACSSSSGGGGNGEEDFESDPPSQSSQSGTWSLDVDLSSSSFGSDSVCASVEGFYGFGPVRKCTNPGPNAEVSFDVPNDETNYEVCTWGGLASALFSNCHNYDNPGLVDQRVVGQFVGG